MHAPWFATKTEIWWRVYMDKDVTYIKLLNCLKPLYWLMQEMSETAFTSFTRFLERNGLQQFCYKAVFV